MQQLQIGIEINPAVSINQVCPDIIRNKPQLSGFVRFAGKVIYGNVEVFFAPEFYFPVGTIFPPGRNTVLNQPGQRFFVAPVKQAVMNDFRYHAAGVGVGVVPSGSVGGSAGVGVGCSGAGVDFGLLVGVGAGVPPFVGCSGAGVDVDVGVSVPVGVDVGRP